MADASRRAARSTSRAVRRATTSRRGCTRSICARSPPRRPPTSLTAAGCRARPRLRSDDDAVDDRRRLRDVAVGQHRRGHRVGARHAERRTRRRSAPVRSRLAFDGVGVGHIRAHARTNGHAQLSRRRRFARRAESLDPEIGDGQSAGRAPPARHGARHSTRQGRLGAHRSRDRDGAHDQRQAGTEARGQRAEVGAGGHVVGLGAYGRNAERQHLRVRRTRASRGGEGGGAWEFRPPVRQRVRMDERAHAAGEGRDRRRRRQRERDGVRIRHRQRARHVFTGRRTRRAGGGSGPESRLQPEGRLRIISESKGSTTDEPDLPIRHGILVDAAAGVAAVGADGSRGLRLRASRSRQRTDLRQRVAADRRRRGLQARRRGVSRRQHLGHSANGRGRARESHAPRNAQRHLTSAGISRHVRSGERQVQQDGRA